MAISCQMSNAPNSGGGTCSIGYANFSERMENADFEHLDIQDDNGLFLADIEQWACGGEKNGAAPCFIGRAIRSRFVNMQCDGVRSTLEPAKCFAWYNSVANSLDNLSVEGTKGTQFLIQHSKQFFARNIGIGSGNAGTPTPNGIMLVDSDENNFTGALGSSTKLLH